jgi:hypothetical protein
MSDGVGNPTHGGSTRGKVTRGSDIPAPRVVWLSRHICFAAYARVGVVTGRFSGRVSDTVSLFVKRVGTRDAERQ